MKLLLLLAACNVLAQDPKDIMRRAMERDERNLALLDTYMYERRTVQKIKRTFDFVACAGSFAHSEPPLFATSLSFI